MPSRSRDDISAKELRVLILAAGILVIIAVRFLQGAAASYAGIAYTGLSLVALYHAVLGALRSK
jgi:hypothetical protein